MKKHKFSPALDGRLEDRLALSATGSSALIGAHVHAAKAVKHPVVTTKQVDQVNRLDNSAFNEFNKEYTNELKTLVRTGNQAKFSSQFAASVAKLRKTLAVDANRLPFGKTTLNPALQARVDSLVRDLESKSSISPTDLITADRFGANHDVSQFIHDEVSTGDLSVK
jgi:hypothetical protein